MKRLILTVGVLLLAPEMAYSADVLTAPSPPDNTTEESSEADSSTLTSSGVSQRASLQSIYASESAVKVNTVYLADSTASGIYAEQVTYIGDAAIVSSNVNINSIQVYSGEISSSVITQSTYVNGMDVQNSSLELNRLILN